MSLCVYCNREIEADPVMHPNTSAKYGPFHRRCLDEVQATEAKWRKQREAELTPREADALEFIRSHVTQRGCSPTQREIGAALGIRSKARIAELLERLSVKGKIVLGHGDARAIRIAGECPACGAARVVGVSGPQQTTVVLSDATQASTFEVGK